MFSQVALIGAGMIAHDQILPSLYQLQRLGLVEQLHVVGQRASTVNQLAENQKLRDAFPGQSFQRWPAEENSGVQPLLYREVLKQLPAQSLVIVALPDDLHYSVVMDCLAADQHIICVKPLVLKAAHALEIAALAKKRGLFVGIEYHKRFDDRSLMARSRYRNGDFGEFQLGSAHLMEKWYYQHSNFQNWCVSDRSDAFCYIGCHYVDLVCFITGLRPTAVSVHGIQRPYPNGNLGFLYTDARVIFDNGGCLNVQNSLCVPDAMPGTNTQGLTMYFAPGQKGYFAPGQKGYFAAGQKGGFLKHSDQYRGLEYCSIDGNYSELSPDYLQLVDVGSYTSASSFDSSVVSSVGKRPKTPVGYGFRSIEYLVRAAIRVSSADGLAERQEILQVIDHEDLLATPSSSFYNEQLMEAARLSILNNGRQEAVGTSTFAGHDQ
jgi:D-galacturonate reductase